MTCSLPECERKAYCRQMCKPHYEAERGYDNARTKPAICSQCGADYQKARGASDKCPRCAGRGWTWSLERRAAYSEKMTKTYPSCKISVVNCAECAGLFTRHHANRIYCGEACAHEAAMRACGCRNRLCRDCGADLGRLSLLTLCDACRVVTLKAARRASRAVRNYRHRARDYGVEYEPFNRVKVFDHDGWRCGICHKTIDKRLAYPDPMSVSLDHIVPLSRGGTHSLANAQAAHLVCNCRKGASAVNEQLKLVG